MQKQNKISLFASNPTPQAELEQKLHHICAQNSMENLTISDNPINKQHNHIKLLQDRCSSNNIFYINDYDIQSMQSPDRQALHQMITKENPTISQTRAKPTQQLPKEAETIQKHQRRIISPQIIIPKKTNNFQIIRIQQNINNSSTKNKYNEISNTAKNQQQNYIQVTNNIQPANNKNNHQKNQLFEQNNSQLKKSKQVISSPQYSPSYSAKPKNSGNSQSECFLEISAKKWQRVVLKITKSKLNIGPISIDYQKIMKIKIFPSSICLQSKFVHKTLIEPHKQQAKIRKQNVIKITTSDNVFQFSQKFCLSQFNQSTYEYSPTNFHQSLANKNKQLQFSLPYLSFAKIIIKKLKQLYPQAKLTDCKGPQVSPKLVPNKQIQLKFNNKKFMGNIIYIHGIIYKKSQHKGDWQKRYIIINQLGIFSYKSEKDDNYSFHIESKSIKYLWTWFTTLKVSKQEDKDNKNIIRDSQIHSKSLTDDIQKMQKSLQNDPPKSIQQTTNNYLIIKTKHGLNEQTQFAIPICGFDNQANKNQNWLYAFYRILCLNNQ